MKKFLLIAGIILAAAGILALLFSAFCRFGYFHTMDASPEYYTRMHARMTTFFVIGLALIAVGAAGIIIRFLK